MTEKVQRHPPGTAVPSYELTDEQWQHVRPWVPGPKGFGRPRADDRRILNGILHVVRNGWRWRDVPQQFGSCATCHRRFQQWQEEGAWDAIWTAYLATLDPAERRKTMKAFTESAAARPRSK
jgi:transposase